jgi:putative nucleotidyltransferase with HDIG domain
MAVIVKVAAFAQVLETRVASGELDIPVLPEAAREVMDACNREECDMRDLAAIVRRDPALAAHFLRLANSSAFGARTAIVSLPQALARLGVSQTRQIALLVTCQARAFVCKTRKGAAQHLRRHSVATAMWAQEIARLRRLNVEEAFLSGLLGDVGMPALWQLADDIETTSDEVHDPAVVDADVARIHDQVGADIASRWGLPNRTVDTIRMHHSAIPLGTVVATGAGASVDATVVTVQLASTLARATLAGEEITPETIQGHSSAVALSLYAEEIELLIARTPAVVEAIRALA